MVKKIIVPGRFRSLNEYIDAERSNRFRAAKIKRDAQDVVVLCARKCLGGWTAARPVWMHYTWYEKDRKRDLDNICAFARKVIQDALVETGVLANDGWAQIIGFDDRFAVDAKNPRIEIELEEVEPSHKAESEKGKPRWNTKEYDARGAED